MIHLNSMLPRFERIWRSFLKLKKSDLRIFKNFNGKKNFFFQKQLFYFIICTIST